MNSMPAAQAVSSHADMAALAHACRALWLATLSLMTAFMQIRAPAHRLMLARRIARNFKTLSGQPCFPPNTRAKFELLHVRWQRKVQMLSPEGEQNRGQGAIGWLRRLLPR